MAREWITGEESAGNKMRHLVTGRGYRPSNDETRWPNGQRNSLGIRTAKILLSLPKRKNRSPVAVRTIDELVVLPI